MKNQEGLNIFVAGHNGMVGSSIVRLLKKQKINLITKNKNELNLLDQHEVLAFFRDHKIDHIYLAAAKVGGILANNTYPAEFIYENLMIQANIIHGAFLTGIKKLLFLGSSCIYPKRADQPILEESLFTGPLELTNEPYAVAKIAGIKMCESYNRQYEKSHGLDFRCIMPTNLYGPGDNYHPENSHVIPGLIVKFHEAKQKNLPEVILWGTGKAKREFLFVDDMARASIHLMNLDKKIYEQYSSPRCSHINVGSGMDITIKELADMISQVVGFEGAIKYDSTMPDGTPRKLLNCQKITKLGFYPEISLLDGLKKTYKKYIDIA